MCLYKNETHVANGCTFKLREMSNICLSEQIISWLALSRNPDAMKKIIRKPCSGLSQEVVML